ncbi:hypothetical protein EV122DRAFT_207513, partial [Schizophyllum commune]
MSSVPASSQNAFLPSASEETDSYAVGSYNSDKLRGYDLEFDSMAHFQTWLRSEERRNGVEFLFHERLTDKRASSAPQWLWKVVYYCGRQSTGGKKTYIPAEGVKRRGKRKVGPKHCGCSSKIILKAYPGKNTLLAYYTSFHSHAIGDDNLVYTRLPEEAREQI